MKSIRLFTTVLLLLVIHFADAQTSQRGFSFQGYAISPEGLALGNEAINTRFTVYPKSGAGFIYEETQNLTTDAYGVFHAVVGSVNPALFQKMDFTAKGADYWMRVEVKKSTAGVYATISDAAMLAVPYARFADNGVPVGTIIPFAGPKTKVPQGWLVCDGTEYDGSDPLYEQLYNVIENTWGGTGTAFNVPELRGYFLRGFDDGAGNDPDAANRTNVAGEQIGDVIGSYQTDTTGVHKHAAGTLTTTNSGTHSHSIDGRHADGIGGGTGDGSIRNPDGDFWDNFGSTDSAGNHSHSISGSTADGGGKETRPKNAYVLYIIKY